MDQADQLRILVRRAVSQRCDLAPGAPAVAVSGAQLGVGATTVACELARELVRLGKQVVLIDADLARPTIADRFKAKPSGTLADVLGGSRRAIEAAANVADGLRLIAGRPTAEPHPINHDALARLSGELAALALHADILLIDAGRGMNPWIDRLWQLAQRVLLATAPTSSAIFDAYSAIKLSQFHRLQGKLRLVVNRCDSAAEAARLHAGLDATCRKFLFCPVQAPVVLPSLDAGDDQFTRAIRLLAADLAGDFRATTHRVRRAAGPVEQAASLLAPNYDAGSVAHAGMGADPL
jgi:MinD-like ATPase involved in chromosome partitioning or flagellar assembly